MVALAVDYHAMLLAGWRCKAYGHRTGDRECPMFISGNKNIEKFRMVKPLL